MNQSTTFAQVATNLLNVLQGYTKGIRFLLVIFLTLGVTTNAWGATYKLTKVTSVSAGEKYVFEQGGYVMNNSVSSSALQCTNSYKTTGLEGTEAYVWTLESATNGFYMKNVSSSQYLNNSSNTSVSFGNKSSIWKFTFTDGIAVIQNISNSNRFLGWTSESSHAYKAYATSNMSSSSYPHNITVYKLEEETSTPGGDTGDGDDSGDTNCLTLSATSNYPFNSTSSNNTSVYSTSIDGITFENKGGYKYNSYLSFNRLLSGAYIANTTPFNGNIESIVVDYNSGGSSYFNMYEGSASKPSSTVVSPSKTGTGSVTYTFSGNNPYFNLALKETGTYCNINSITICYSNTPAPSFTITATSNNNSYGTVSVNGTTITATPATGYRVSISSPYSVSPAGSATVTQNDNTFTVTPTANCTITINFEAIPTYTINWHTAVGTVVDEVLEEGATITKPATDPTMAGYVFMGWTEDCEVASDGAGFTAITNFGTATEDKDYYAVFATSNNGDGDVEGEAFYTNEGSQGEDQTTAIVASGNINTKNGNGDSGNCIGLTSAATKTFTFSNINTSNYSTVSLQFDHKIGKYTNYPTLTISCGDFVKTIQGSTGKYITALYNDFPIGKNLTLTFTISAASGNNYSQTYLDNISLIGYKATTTYSNYRTTCITKPSYSVTSTLSHVTAAGGNPTTVTSEDEDLTLTYLPEDGWNLPATISVTMGGNSLMLNNEYTWDKENGKVWIVPDNGFTGDIVVTINGWQQLAPPSELNVSNITSSSATLSWDAVANASSYTVELLGENKDPIKTFSNLNATTITISDLESSTNYILGVVAVGDGSTYLDSEQTLSDVFTTSSATCTVTYDANGGEGTITDDTEYTNGATVTVLGNYGMFTKDGHAFTGWNTKADGSGYSYNHNDQFDITTNTTLYAQWCKAYWKLVTDESELENDTRIVIAAKDYNVALSTKQNDNNRGQATITKTYNTVTFGDDVQTLSLVGLSNNQFALYTGSGYLYAASKSANQLKTKEGFDLYGNSDWSIGFTQEGAATILAQGDKTHNQIKYNHQQSGQLFSCYESTNTAMSDVVIYKEVCKQDSYNVKEELTYVTAANTNAKTVLATAKELTLNYSANTGNLLPETITVKMGGATLASGTDYIWNQETGELTITVTGFYGDIDVKIIAEADPCYQFEMSTVTATSTTNSITLTWTAVEGATGYNVRLDGGEFTSATGLTHTIEDLSPKTTYNWEVQAVKDGANFHCEASQTSSTTTQKETFTVSWSVNGNVTSTESVVDGEKIKNYPSDPPAPSGCSTKVFVGWTNNPINTPTNETPAILYKQKSDVPTITETKTLHAVWADEKRVEGQPLEVEETASVNISSYASANSWENDTKYESVIINSKITASASSNGTNTGKYFTNGNNWRFYQSDKGQLTITAADGCTIKTVKITYTVDKTGVLTYSGSNKESNSEITVNASSATFGVGNTASATNGQVRITDISVTYTTTTEGPDEITYSAYTTLCDNCTPSEALVLEASANTADLDINGKATITFSTTGGNGGAITYTANPKNGVSWENGVATFTQKGNYQITASQEKNGEYCPTTSNTVNVTITAIPHLYFVTEPANPIVFDPVECGGNTRVEDKKSVSVQGYNLAAAVTAQVTGPYKIARTSGATLDKYSTTLTLDKNEEDGHINGYYDDIYILSFPPAGSSEPTEGTLTFTTTNGNTLTVNLSTPTITCTPRTLTFNDRGIKTTQEYYAGTEVPEPATPTGVCGEYEFDGWALAKVESGLTTYEKVKFPYNMPANNQTVLHAVYRYLDKNIPDTQYELVSSVESGKNYILAALYNSKYYALTNSIVEGKNRDEAESVEVPVSNDILTCDKASAVWNIQGNPTAGYTFYNASANGYLNMLDKDYSSDLSIQADKNNATLFTFEFTGSSLTILAKNHMGICPYLSFNSEVKYYTAFRNSSVPLYLFKQLATTYYTTTPDCSQDVTLTSDGEVYVTATNGRGIMAATPLTLTTTDLAPNTEIAISSNSSDIYFSTERNTNFAMAQASQPKTSLTLTTNEGGELEKQLYIHYKPNADGDGTPAEVVVTADVSTHNPPFTAQKTIHVRNLPAKFVIATKAGATWYALPANMNGATNPSAVVIEVDETTMTATAPNTTPYTLWPVATINGGTDRYQEYGERLRFAAVNNGNKGLWANNSKEGTDINNYAAITAANSTAGAAYEWKVTTAVVNGQWQYTLQTDQANNQKNLCYRMNQENPAWGTYASNEAQYQLYFLPIKAETTPFDYQVVEWYPNKVLIHTTIAFSSLTAKIAGEQVADVKYTSKDANQYEVTGLPLMENPAKALTLEFVVADATHTGIHTIPVMLSRGDYSISTLAIDEGIYNYTDLVVRDGATLTIDGTTKADNTFYDVTIYPTAKISVPEGKHLSVHRMTFIGGITEVYDGSNYTLNKYAVPELSLKGNLGKTVTTMDYVMRVNLDQMYSLALPYDVALDDITYGDGSAIELGFQLYVSAYDGAARAQNLGANNNWVYETDFATKFGSATLKAGVGYTISAQPQTSGDNYAILRLPMKSNIASGNTEAAKSVAVTAHGAGAAIADNHKGWNLVANPYMASISGDSDEYSELMLRYMEMLPGGTWQWTGEEQRYVTIPYNDGSGYYQLKFSEAVLQPFKNFFVQVGTTGDLDFVLAHRQNAPARYMQTNTEREVEFEIILGNSLHQDNAGMLISDKYTPAYEINADLEKMTGSMSLYTIYNGYKLAYNATSLNEAEEWIPVGYIVPKVGEYTFKLDERAAVEDIIHIYLMDNETGVITDLIDNIYTFETSVKKNENRFAISVVLSQEESGTTTGVDDLLQQDKQAQKFIYNDQLFILRDGVVYDAMGQRITTINK